MRAESPLQSPADTLHSAFFTLHLPRRAFTLVELLVVMTILGLLASMVMFALASAQESARVAKTESTINKINAIIMRKYDSYRTRRVPVDVKAVAAFKSYLNGPPGWARARIDVLHELMRMEMPDSFSDISDGPITKWKTGSTTVTMTRPSASQAYFTTLQSKNAAALNTTKLQQAMCLYLIVTKGCDDPDVLEEFAPDEIASDDATGLNYFVDGWGSAIYFLRWAPGFVSPLQQSAATATSHDPFDPMGVYKTPSDPSKSGYDPKFPTGNKPPLFPLIYSPGPDKGYELETAPGIRYSTINNNPYYCVDTPPTIGVWKDENQDGEDNSIDNITNHSLGVQ
jgi:prepilin-type N-terminal cleavage/methylation domain-containing protein